MLPFKAAAPSLAVFVGRLERSGCKQQLSEVGHASYVLSARALDRERGRGREEMQRQRGDTETQRERESDQLRTGADCYVK